jgi:hypothetical protein
MPHSRTPSALHSLDLLQKALFTHADPKSFLDKRRGDNIIDAFNYLLLNEDEAVLQTELAPFLRAAAIKNLKSGESEYAIETRTNYLLTYLSGGIQQSLEDFLEEQAGNGVWAKSTEAGALADLFNFTLIVTTINADGEQAQFKLATSTNPTPTVIHLYNKNDVHWYFYKDGYDDTKGDGNCFYNAFAQALRYAVKFQRHNMQNNNIPLSDADSSLYESQEKLLASFKNVKAAGVQAIIAQLPAETSAAEQEREDHEFALKLLKQDQEEKEKLLAKRKTPINKKMKVILPLFTPPKDDSHAEEFYRALIIMAEEAQKLKLKSRDNPEYIKAATTTKALVDALNKAATNYFNHKISTSDFVKRCNLAIKKAQPVLENIRGWKLILGNIALAIVGIGIGYLVAGIVNKALTGNFLFFRPGVTRKLKQLENAVKPLGFNPGSRR